MQERPSRRPAVLLRSSHPAHRLDPVRHVPNHGTGFWQSAHRFRCQESASKREPLVVEGLSRDIGNGPIRADSEVRKGQRWRVKVMQELIEFYEMVALNDAALRGSEKTAILRARLALSMFERAMESLKRASTGAPSEARGWFRIAA